MKGLNTKRIAAIAASALMLGSSAVAADVMYKNVQLVNDNGQPLAKIVVGEAAALSDGIAAANIAAVLANYAYKSSTLSAGLSGDATCTTAGGEGGEGKCEVTDKKVTIEITMPGEVAGAYSFYTLLSDYVDKKVQNRDYTTSGDQWTGTYSNKGTLSDVSEYLNAMRGTSTSQDVDGVLYMIGSDAFSGFKPVNVIDEQATDARYTAYQSFWVGGKASALDRISSSTAYDETNSVRDVVFRPRVLAYSVSFKGTNYGIPVCTAGLASNQSDYYASCASSSSTDRSDQHRIQIPFMGEKWIISELSPPTGSSAVLANEEGIVNGGYVKLAKESSYGIVTVGEELDGGAFQIRLADIARASTASNVQHAIVDIVQGETVVGQVQITPGTTYTYFHPTSGQSVKIHVYQTAPGLYLHSKWAEMAVYTDEIKIEDAKKYKPEDTDDEMEKYYAAVYWKNRNGKSEATTGDNADKVDSLREIVIHNYDKFSTTQRYKANEAINFPPKDTKYRLTFNGLDLTDADRQDIVFSNAQGQELELCQYDGGWLCSSTGTQSNVTVSGNFIKIETPDSYAMGGEGITSTDKTKELYIDPIGIYYNSSTGPSSLAISAVVAVPSGVETTWSQNKTRITGSAAGTPVVSPTLYWKTSSDDNWRYATITGGTTLSNPDANTVSTTNAVYLSMAGSDSGAKGMLFFNFLSNYSAAFSSTGHYDSSLSNLIGEVVVQEDAGEMNQTSHARVWTRVPITNLSATSGSGQWRFKNSDTATAYTYYAGLNLTDSGTNNLPQQKAAAIEPTLITERGSVIDTVSTTEWSMKIAKRVGKTKFTFSAATDEVAGDAGEEWVASEGDMKELSNGVKLKVKKITCTTGACVAEGGDASCTVNMNPVRAVLKETTGVGMVDVGASKEVSIPYEIKGSDSQSMVITDKQAASAGGVIISVGGPAVNTVTASILADQPVDFEAKNVVVDAYDNKIVVAGYKAADTMTAAEEFIGELKKN